MQDDRTKARAVRLDHYGDRDVLNVVDVPMPRPAAGEVLVEVRAAGINPGESAVRAGALFASPLQRSDEPSAFGGSPATPAHAAAPGHHTMTCTSRAA